MSIQCVLGCRTVQTFLTVSEWGWMWLLGMVYLVLFYSTLVKWPTSRINLKLYFLRMSKVDVIYILINSLSVLYVIMVLVLFTFIHLVCVVWIGHLVFIFVFFFQSFHQHNFVSYFAKKNRWYLYDRSQGDLSSTVPLMKAMHSTRNTRWQSTRISHHSVLLLR